MITNNRKHPANDVDEKNVNNNNAEQKHSNKILNLNFFIFEICFYKLFILLIKFIYGK
jgi:hypothetical protein